VNVTHPAAAAYLRELHAEARRLPADERSELLDGIQARIDELTAAGADDVEMQEALTRLGSPRAVVEQALAGAGPSVVPRYRHTMVVLSLVAAWTCVLSGLAFDPWLYTGTAMFAAMILASAVWSIASLALLIVSILARMWRRWLDGVTTAAVLLLAPAAPVAVVGSLSTTANEGDGCGDAAATGAEICFPGGPSAVTWRILLALVLVIVLAATLHWVVRLRRDRPDGATQPVSTRALAVGAVGVLAVSVGAVALLVSSTYIRPDPVSRIVNDTKGTVRVTHCPAQDCSGRRARTLEPGEHMTVPVTAGEYANSIVVTSDDHPARCLLLPFLGHSTDSGEQLTGSVTLSIKRLADTATCGNDLQSLDD
jgi:hypothetical protein